MLYPEYSRIAVSLANILIIVGLYHQAWTIWRTKSAKDFTWTLIMAVAVNEAAWLNYGFAIHEWPIIMVGALNTPAIIWTVVGFIKYRKRVMRDER